MKKRKDTRPISEKRADPTSDLWLNKADKQWREYLHKKFNGCIVCGQSWGKLDCHHIIGSAKHLTRHHPLNGVLLCVHHHKWNEKLSAHANPKEFKKFLSEKYPENYNFFMTKRFIRGIVDFEQAYHRLVDLTDKL